MRRLLLLLTAGFGAGLAHAQPMPQRPKNELLARVFASGASLVYQGERKVTIRRRGKMEEYTEVILKNGPNVKIKFFGGDEINNQIIVENGLKRWHYIPKRNEIRESPARQEESLMFLMGPMMMGGEGRPGGGPRGGDERRREGGGQGGPSKPERRGEPIITETKGINLCNRQTRLLTISDPTTKRALIKLWIDPTNAVILKRMAYGPNDEPLGGYEFNLINFSPRVSASAFFPPAVPGAKRVTVEDLLMVEAKKLSMKPYRLQGEKEYQLLSVRGFSQDASKILMLIYTNGRNRLTLFQVKGKFDADRFKSEAGMRFETYPWKMDGLYFALVGNLDQAKLKTLAKKVKA